MVSNHSILSLSLQTPEQLHSVSESQSGPGGEAPRSGNLRKVERDKKTMDQEIVELTNKLLDAKNTIDRLEELNERYRQDCNLAVQLLKCNKSHFRNHKFADVSNSVPLWLTAELTRSYRYFQLFFL
ncbi:hypothetical protein XENOCAPTIV_015151 [Xenoophorus captivus]|uniref:Uncharacterized protein n=1 Tax=Xenoophorus captivus TaxID=1517983 RepID=A0ABV0R0I0_9TELE